MNWQPFLEAGEDIEWEARPAPRCFTFRHWKQALFGLFFLTVCLIWMFWGTQVAGEYDRLWLGLLPIPLVAAGCYMAFSPLLVARLEWEQVFYALTNRRLITLRGIRRQRAVVVERQEILYFRMNKQGENLATLVVHARPQDPVLFLHCIEYPFAIADRLEKIIERNITRKRREGTLPEKQ